MGGWKRLPCLDFLHVFSLSTNSGQSIKYGKFSNMNSLTKAPLRVRSSEVTRTCQSQTTFCFTLILNQANKKHQKPWEASTKWNPFRDAFYSQIFEILTRVMKYYQTKSKQCTSIFAANHSDTAWFSPTKVLPREALTTHQTCWNLANMTLVWRVFVDSWDKVYWMNVGKRNPNEWQTFHRVG